MKTKLNFKWNNTDWSVSHIEHRSLERAKNLKPMKQATRSRNLDLSNILDLPKPTGQTRTGGSLAVALENARREAASLAWSTGYPQLLLPCLQEELESRAVDYWTKQREVHVRSAGIVRRTFAESLLSRAA
ncbi:MAG TPA: hypothetical protein DCY13_16630 [Verrucomicrobiales bacterium]|nr:hypothetical protein [Verrucomicrobiales bacterium]